VAAGSVSQFVHWFGSRVAKRCQTVTYKVVLHRSDEGVSVNVPALPGCWSEGDTEAEALENIRDAIREYLAALEDQQPHFCSWPL